MPGFICSICRYLFTLAVCLNSSISYIADTRINLMILHSVPHCSRRNISISEFSWRNSNKNQILLEPSECSRRAIVMQEIPLHTDPTTSTQQSRSQSSSRKMRHFTYPGLRKPLSQLCGLGLPAIVPADCADRQRV